MLYAPNLPASPPKAIPGEKTIIYCSHTHQTKNCFYHVILCPYTNFLGVKENDVQSGTNQMIYNM